MASQSPNRSGDSIYEYETKEGTRYRFAYRDAAGNQSTKRGFTSRSAARKEPPTPHVARRARRDPRLA